jgi:hypothetical protein
MWIEIDGVRETFEEVEEYIVALDTLSKEKISFKCEAFEVVFPEE